MNDYSIFNQIISWDYLISSLANEYVGDVTIPTQVIKYNKKKFQVDQPIRLQYSHQIKLYWNIQVLEIFMVNRRHPWFLVGSVLLIFFLVFCVVFFVCLSSSCALRTQCYQFLHWIVHSWLPLRLVYPVLPVSPLDCPFLIAPSSCVSSVASFSIELSIFDCPFGFH